MRVTLRQQPGPIGSLE